jgi:inner membrane protein
VENITHSLVGATLAELALPAGARTVQRRLFFFAGIVAANLSDGDLLYSRITPPPLGYLLHHRGHTHTLVGCALLGFCGWLVTRLVPPVRRLVAESPRQFWMLVAVALGSHMLLDSWNSYGVHPFWPFDNRWYYGDAIYILDPWLWVLLGVAVVLNARSMPRRIVLGAGLVALPLALVWFRMIPSGALVALAVIGAGLAVATHRALPRVRSAAALSAVAVFVTAMFGLSHVARGVSLASLRTVQGADDPGDIVDVVLNPNPAVPVCWSALAIEKREARDEYVLRRGNLSLFDGWLPARICRSSGSVAGFTRSRAEWSVSSRQSLSRLRTRSRDDCWVRGWLQFGRAPAMTNDHIADYRFGGEEGGNFTSMRLLDSTLAKVCPPHLTNWGMPRADLLGGALEN